MAILNEYPVIGPNIAYLVVGVLLTITGLSCAWIMHVARSNKAFAISMILTVVCLFSAPHVFMEYHNPDSFAPTGKTRIEATFAKGDIPAYYLDKYKVIDKVNGNVYILEEK